jgi:hypothetical protein
MRRATTTRRFSIATSERGEIRINLGFVDLGAHQSSSAWLEAASFTKRSRALELNQSLVRVCLYRLSQSERKKEVSNPTPLLQRCALLSKQAWRLASFSSVVSCHIDERKKEVSNPTPPKGGAICFQGSPGSQPVFLPLLICGAWDWNRTNYARLFRPALYRMSYPSVSFISRKAEDLNLTQVVPARIAFQAISVPDGFAFHSLCCSSQDGRI